ncbi:unnamed protein product, partial [Closterium sp. NIES-64]
QQQVFSSFFPKPPSPWLDSHLRALSSSPLSSSSTSQSFIPMAIQCPFLSLSPCQAPLAPDIPVLAQLSSLALAPLLSDFFPPSFPLLPIPHPPSPSLYPCQAPFAPLSPLLSNSHPPSPRPASIPIPLPTPGTLCARHSCLGAAVLRGARASALFFLHPSGSFCTLKVPSAPFRFFLHPSGSFCTLKVPSAPFSTSVLPPATVARRVAMMSALQPSDAMLQSITASTLLIVRGGAPFSSSFESTHKQTLSGPMFTLPLLACMQWGGEDPLIPSVEEAYRWGGLADTISGGGILSGDMVYGDRLIPSVEEAYGLATCIPSCRIKILPFSGHTALLEAGVSLRDILEECRVLLPSAAFPLDPVPPSDDDEPAYSEDKSPANSSASSAAEPAMNGASRIGISSAGGITAPSAAVRSSGESSGVEGAAGYSSDEEGEFSMEGKDWNDADVAAVLGLAGSAATDAGPITGPDADAAAFASNDVSTMPRNREEAQGEVVLREWSQVRAAQARKDGGSAEVWKGMEKGRVETRGVVGGGGGKGGIVRSLREWSKGRREEGRGEEEGVRKSLWVENDVVRKEDEGRGERQGGGKERQREGLQGNQGEQVNKAKRGLRLDGYYEMMKGKGDAAWADRMFPQAASASEAASASQAAPDSLSSQSALGSPPQSKATASAASRSVRANNGHAERGAEGSGGGGAGSAAAAARSGAPDAANGAALPSSTSATNGEVGRALEGMLDDMPQYRLWNWSVGVWEVGRALEGMLDDMPQYRLWNWVAGPLYVGLEKIPRNEEKLLFVGNHTIFGIYDMPLMIRDIHMRTGVTLRGLGAPTHWQGPFAAQFTKYGAVRVSPRACYQLLREGENLLLYPGGGREVGKRKNEKYKLFWRDTTDFVRIAVRCGATIVPFSTIGVEDAFDVLMDPDQTPPTLCALPCAVAPPILPFSTIGVEDAFDMLMHPDEIMEIMSSPIGPWLKPALQATGMQSPPFPLASNAGLLPRPQRLYFLFSDPIRTDGLDPTIIRDKEECSRIYQSEPSTTHFFF